MSDGIYKLTFHSLVRWTKQFNIEAQSLLQVPRIEFVNFDAHYEGKVLPDFDVVGISDFSFMPNTPETNIMLAWVVSVHNDPDLVRCTDIVDLLVERLRNGAVIPIWRTDGSTISKESWMKVADDIDVGPVERDKQQRAYVGISTRLVSGLTGRPVGAS